MIGTHAAGADAAKAHVRCCQMDDGVIDAAAAKRAGLCDAPHGLFVLGKQVQRERMRMAVDGCECLVQRIIRQDGKNRPENFFLHHGIVPCDIGQNGGADAVLLRLKFAAIDQLVSVNKTGDSVKMLLIDDFSVFGITQSIRAELTADFAHERFYQRIAHACIAVNIIRCDAGLSAV